MLPRIAAIISRDLLFVMGFNKRNTLICHYFVHIHCMETNLILVDDTIVRTCCLITFVRIFKYMQPFHIASFTTEIIVQMKNVFKYFVVKVKQQLRCLSDFLFPPVVKWLMNPIKYIFVFLMIAFI